MKKLSKYIIFLSFTCICLTQIQPLKYPKSFLSNNDSIIDTIKHNKKNINIYIYKNISKSQISLPNKGYYKFKIDPKGLNKEDDVFLINNNNLKEIYGPYNESNIFYTDIIYTDSIILEINSNSNIIKELLIEIIPISTNQVKRINTKLLKTHWKTRENPIILVTGFWPPTNEMIRHFSQNSTLNPNGWVGDNWENRGYDIISYFPTFADPDCTSCGTGSGDLEVDYQDTSNDFWPIASSSAPIGIITFSRGFNNQSWELEYNYYNRTNWINDYVQPYLPTPNPPDENVESFFLRNSNLPMNDIIENVDLLNLGLNAYIDENGDPGRFVSEFMGYHGVWYRDLNINGDNRCVSAGHVHVGGQIDVETARLATNETIRTLINHLDQLVYTPGDINQDDLIDILDLVLIMNYILGNNNLSQLQFYASDLNEDQIINIQDIIIIINIILNNF